MIIFGWGHQKSKNYGPVFKHHCDHCNNDDYWTLHKISTWFTLFFIPVFPYESKCLLICPVCNYGVELDGQKFNELKVIAENNSALIEGRITEEEYKNRVNQLESGKK